MNINIVKLPFFIAVFALSVLFCESFSAMAATVGFSQASEASVPQGANSSVSQQNNAASQQSGVPASQQYNVHASHQGDAPSTRTNSVPASRPSESPVQRRNNAPISRSETAPRGVGSPSASRNASSEESSVKPESDPFLRDANGVQRYFPSVAKIVGRSATRTSENGSQSVPFYYGTGTLVSEYREWGVVVTNWHVVSEAEESIDVIFPTGVYPARVILRDEIWDLAALVIPLPKDVAPTPIAVDYPALGETYWVGGYGHTNGLSDFQMRSGKLTNFVSLVKPDDEIVEELFGDEEEVQVDPNDPYRLQEARKKALSDEDARRLANSNPKQLYETLSIRQGVRQGDSGGPILNRYGELAGILWGSDGKCTMGTSCVRLRDFTTQAMWKAAAIYANNLLTCEETGGSPFATTPWPEAPTECAVAEDSDVPARTALESRSVFPTSSRRLYSSASGETAETFVGLSRSDAILLAKRGAADYFRKHGAVVPPSPPIYSPSFVVLQKTMDCVDPEVISPELIRKVDAYSMAKAKEERRSQELRFARSAQGASGVVALQNASAESLRSSAPEPELTLVSAAITDDEHDDKPNETSDAQKAESENASNVQSSAASAGNSAEANARQNAASESGPNVASAADQASEPARQAEKENEAEEARDTRLSSLTTYVVVILFFFLFFLAMRLLDDVENSRGKKREKARLRREK